MSKFGTPMLYFCKMKKIAKNGNDAEKMCIFAKKYLINEQKVFYW